MLSVFLYSLSTEHRELNWLTRAPFNTDRPNLRLSSTHFFGPTLRAIPLSDVCNSLRYYCCRHWSGAGGRYIKSSQRSQVCIIGLSVLYLKLFLAVWNVPHLNNIWKAPESLSTWGGRAAVRWSGQPWTPGADGPHSLPASGPAPRSENQ